MKYERIGTEVAEMAKPESARKKMLPIDPIMAATRLRSGRAFHEEIVGVTVSFGTFDDLEECTEIRSIITHADYRRQGLATKVAERTILGAQMLTQKPIIALCNNESMQLMHKLGLRPSDKAQAFPELWEACVECKEYGTWPTCHCQFMQLHGKMYEKNGNIFSVIDLSKGDKSDLNNVAELYTEVWQEPPWNEEYDPTQVQEDFQMGLARENGQAMVAVYKGKIAGFSSGWNIGPREIFARTNGAISPKEFGDNQVFYVAELGTGRDFRGTGIGKQLMLDLIKAAKNGGAKRFLLRTDKNATAARRLYNKLGFTETEAVDSKFASRTYWVL